MPEPKPQVKGGANSDFLRKHGFDEHSHPMDWFNTLLTVTPEDNLENPAVANVKGDKKSKLLISTWSAYSNAKASLTNAGDKGHIF